MFKTSRDHIAELIQNALSHTASPPQLTNFSIGPYPSPNQSPNKSDDQTRSPRTANSPPHESLNQNQTANRNPPPPPPSIQPQRSGKVEIYLLHSLVPRNNVQKPSTEIAPSFQLNNASLAMPLSHLYLLRNAAPLKIGYYGDRKTLTARLVDACMLARLHFLLCKIRDFVETARFQLPPGMRRRNQMLTWGTLRYVFSFYF